MDKDPKDMSPEELAQYQKKNCIFCHIISGKVKSRKVYEDENVLAVLDINPASEGHVLLLPKEHFVIMPQMDEDLISHMFTVAKQISHKLLKTLKAKGTNIFVANGAVAGQKAPHFMIHIIPRMENDGLDLSLPENEAGDIDEVADKLRRRMRGEPEKPDTASSDDEKQIVEEKVDLDSLKDLL